MYLNVDTSHVHYNVSLCTSKRECTRQVFTKLYEILSACPKVYLNASKYMKILDRCRALARGAGPNNVLKQVIIKFVGSIVRLIYSIGPWNFWFKRKNKYSLVQHERASTQSRNIKRKQKPNTVAIEMAKHVTTGSSCGM